MKQKTETMSTEQIPLLYEDAAVVAVHKPAWSVVHPTRGAAGATVLVRALADQLGQRVYNVHRLDRQTTGVLLFARSAEVAAVLSSQIRDGQWRKTYLGLCRGLIEQELRVDRGVKEDGLRREALTEVVPLEHLCGRYTLVRAVPRTGRRHQIRYHLRHVGHPLVGDTSYGKGPINRFFRDTFGLQHLFLHAETLRLPHPVEHRLLQLEAPLAPHLAEVLRQLRGHRGEVA